MDNNKLLDTILIYLKQKGVLSDIEKDLLSTVEKYIERPFDRKGAEEKITENNCKYPDIFATISAMQSIECKPFSDVTDQEVLHNLFLQIEGMWAKILLVF